jgi:hypothetical protein
MILRRIVRGVVPVAGVVPGTGVTGGDPRKFRNTPLAGVRQATVTGVDLG